MVNWPRAYQAEIHLVSETKTPTDYTEPNRFTEFHTVQTMR